MLPQLEELRWRVRQLDKDASERAAALADAQQARFHIFSDITENCTI